MNTNDYIYDLRLCINKLSQDYQVDKINKIVDILKNSENIYICGNGGSSATASHIVNDLQKMCKKKTFCLSDSTPLMTAWSNDNGYNVAFMKQLELLAKEGDTLIVISGSGNSENLFNAVSYANHKKMNTIAFLGMDGGRLLKNIKLTEVIHIESDMQHAEDWHLILGHIIVKLLEE